MSSPQPIEGNTDARELFGDLDGDEFGDLIASTWREQGWNTRTRAAEEALPALADPIDGELTLIGRASDERLVLTRAADDGEMTAPELLELVSAVSAPRKLTVVAAAGFTTGSLSVADAYGVDVVGPGALSRLTEHLENENGFRV